MPGASPQMIGIATHEYVKAQVNTGKDPTLTVAPSLGPVPGTKIPGNILADINENVGNGTLCIYDFKTGFRGLPVGRADEFALRTIELLKDVKPSVSRVYVITMRPN